MTRTRRRAQNGLLIALLCILAAGTLAVGQLPALASDAAVFWIVALALLVGAFVLAVIRWRQSQRTRE